MGFYNVYMEGQQAEEYKKKKEEEEKARIKRDNDRYDRYDERKENRESDTHSTPYEKMRIKGHEQIAEDIRKAMEERLEKQELNTKRRLASMSKGEFDKFAKIARVNPEKQGLTQDEENRIMNVINKDTSKADPIVHPIGDRETTPYWIDQDAYITHMRKKDRKMHSESYGIFESVVFIND